MSWKNSQDFNEDLLESSVVSIWFNKFIFIIQDIVHWGLFPINPKHAIWGQINQHRREDKVPDMNKGRIHDLG